MKSLFGAWALLLAAVLAGLPGGDVSAQRPAAAEPASAPALVDPLTRDEAATLRLLHRDIVTFRATVAGTPPAKRVEHSLQRIGQLPDMAMDQPLRALPFAVDGTRGIQFLLGEAPLFAIVQADVGTGPGQTLEALSQQTLARLELARKAWHDSRDRPLLLLGLLKAVAVTAALGLLAWGVVRITRRVALGLEALRDRLAAQRRGVDWRELLARLLGGTIQLVQWLALLLLGYFWLQLVLASFVATQPLADRLDGWFWGQLSWVAQGALQAVPGIATLAIVLLLTRALADVSGYFFDAVQQGRLVLPFVHPETTTATRRIFTVVIWGLGIAIAYPYLPGSDSEAFKGLSVLAGVMFTLGSAGLVTQAMSGLVVIYSRALRKGDYVDVNGVQGVVTEVASLAVKIRSVRNEEITVPNSVLVSSPIFNYSKLAHTHGTLLTTKVTIGYDAPWRQVHAMLEEAARRTPRVRAQPAPYVYQRALSDFYVEYELFVSVDSAGERVPIQSALHASIQDVFNENGVQIMSPHFLGQPAHAVVVPRDDWFKAPARPPAE
ncbi:MAG: mechanosensitive ion channel family protein [Betaproteobacteria bacterium]|nr:mechanosensitive ion channel family protein [Rubrivivax sp.]